MDLENDRRKDPEHPFPPFFPFFSFFFKKRFVFRVAV
jgi:hypothetical protein